MESAKEQPGWASTQGATASVRVIGWTSGADWDVRAGGRQEHGSNAHGAVSRSNTEGKAMAAECPAFLKELEGRFPVGALACAGFVLHTSRYGS